ncbi:MAG: DUF4065 domain-containing protein [Clostridiales bacterium]|nr:DUF4065 domain-containing protein [Clostridiales bacterium]
MTPMMLEKLCYYAQAWTLAWRDVPLFDEDFQACEVGVVCFDLFNALPSDVIFFDGVLGEYDANVLTEQQTEDIDVVLEKYADKMPSDVTWMIRCERPWRTARENYSEEDNKFPLISKFDMHEYHAGLLLPKEKRDLNIYES